MQDICFFINTAENAYIGINFFFRRYPVMFPVYFWQWFCFLAVSVLGTLLHFLYDKTGSPVAALFSSVNESTWEHMKLLFFPLLLFAIVQGFFLGPTYDNFWCIKLRGTLLDIYVPAACAPAVSGPGGWSLRSEITMDSYLLWEKATADSSGRLSCHSHHTTHTGRYR